MAHDNICMVKLNSTGEEFYMKEVNLITEFQYKEKLNREQVQKVIDKYSAQAWSRYTEKELKQASDECKAAMDRVPSFLVDEEAQELNRKLQLIIDQIAEAAREKGMDVSEDGTINYELSEEDTTGEDSFQQGVDDLREEDLEDQVWVYDNIYNYPKRTKVGDVGDDIDSAMSNADDFVNNGDVASVYDTNDLQRFSSSIYNILLTVGIVVAVIVGAVIGIKLMSSGIETKVEAKKLLIPYVAGCIVVFGGFAIWKIVVTILQRV